MRQLKPGTSEYVGEVLRIFVELLSNFAIVRIHFHGHISVSHNWVMTNGRILHIDRFIFLFNVDRFPLPGTSRALLQLPLVVKQQVEVAVVPLRWVCRPGTFNATTHGVAAHTFTTAVAPAKALLFNICRFRLRT